MQYAGHKDAITTVLRNSKQVDGVHAIHRIICYYFKKIYNGYELPIVIENFYYDRLFLMIMLTIGKSESYAEFGEENMKKFNNLIGKTILTSKVNSFKARLKLYFRWMGGKANYEGQNDILDYLWKMYPTVADRDEVKKLLGVNDNMETLRRKIQEIN